jgi:Periplasmic binding protein
MTLNLHKTVTVALAAALVVAASCSTRTTPTGNRAATTTTTAGHLRAGQTGVTATELHVAVIADVDNAFRPGLFQDAVDGVRAWAADVNGRGGLAGRHVVVDFYDSKLNADEFRNAQIKACQSDFAIVGTAAIFDNNVDEMVKCGLPEIQVLATFDTHRAAANSFATIPSGSDKEGVGPERWYLREFGAKGCCKGVWLDPADIPGPLATAAHFRKAELQLGFTEAKSFPVSGLESNFTPFAQTIKQTGATYVRVGTDYNQTVKLRQEAQVQGVSSVLVWDCSLQCYDPDFIRTGGAAVEGQYVYTATEPFEEAGRYPAVARYLRGLRAHDPKAEPNGFSVQAWGAGQLFQQAVEQVVKASGDNGLTRAGVIDALRGIHDFDGGGLFGKTDVGGHSPPPCFVIMQVRGGKFVRVYPTAGLDCSPGNVVTVR